MPNTLKLVLTDIGLKKSNPVSNYGKYATIKKPFPRYV